ncbi:MAG: ABC transporter substrate-binding protein [Lachnospiraceae bacterium]|nr:ABC transporter substrate-binding protein [Lachnospiraceae bacterium]
MRRFQKTLALSLATVMSVASLAGCGGSAAETATTAAAPAGTTAAATETTAAATSAEGSVLNIYVWNEEFRDRVVEFYPGYEKVDDATGKIGDVKVVWNTTPNKDNAYQNNLDETLLKQEKAAADDKIDIFLIEADYALKYVDSEYTMAVKDLGIADADIADQYQYTKDIVTDSNGVLKGLSWQACSAGLIYNRDAAKAVLGTDDPAEVQKAVADWKSFNETALKAQAKGYTMCSANDTYRVYSNNVSSPWVVDGKVVIDENIEAWVDDSKALVDAKAENSYDLWGDDWGKGKYEAGKVFCYFGPAWFFNFSLGVEDKASIAAAGKWGFVVGPQSYYWGGTWICGATGTDNPTLVSDIMKTMTTDKTVLKDIAVKKADCVNSKSVLADLASSSDGNVAILGGQNPYAVLAEGAEKVDMSNVSPYDQGCNEEFQNAMKNYFINQSTKEDAIALFKKKIVVKYPELKVE